MLPVMLDLRDQLVLVVGSGTVATRKQGLLIAAGARARVVSLSPPPAKWPGEWLQEPFRADHLIGCRLVFAAATPEVNRVVVAEARARGLWVNAASEPETGTMHFPAVLRQGDFTIAVSTGGASPTFATVVRDRLAAQFDESIGRFVDRLREQRHAILNSDADEATRRAKLEALATWEAYRTFIGS
ncbi:hypothetical protein BH11PLA2_BH11PLA2_27760 [soil metagenome]